MELTTVLRQFSSSYFFWAPFVGRNTYHVTAKAMSTAGANKDKHRFA